MAFVGLTAEPRPRAAAFTEEFSVPWPCGYGMALEDVARWGAYSTSRMSGTYNPGYEVTPTLYLLGPDGRVRWCDGQARPRHASDPAALLRRLDAAIEAALSDAPRSP